MSADLGAARRAFKRLLIAAEALVSAGTGDDDASLSFPDALLDGARAALKTLTASARANAQARRALSMAMLVLNESDPEQGHPCVQSAYDRCERAIKALEP